MIIIDIKWAEFFMVKHKKIKQFNQNEELMAAMYNLINMKAMIIVLLINRNSVHLAHLFLSF